MSFILRFGLKMMIKTHIIVFILFFVYLFNLLHFAHRMAIW